uniref:Bacteriophage/plasmid primase P4 C-terminal domain-containing protein n=1 Tax=Pseudochlorodesmis sp. HV01306b TaxID=2358489 RepID=A0A386AY86_9CHLO|nr:hypothetical protein [Pseudochlorodesmis sp. HV01306b]
MDHTLLKFIKEHVLYVHKLGIYLVYEAGKYLWEQTDIDGLTKMCLYKYNDRMWDFYAVHRVLKSIDSNVMTEYSTIDKLIHSKSMNFIPFTKGCWDIQKQLFRSDFKKTDYLFTTLPFEYKPLLESEPNINKVAPKICQWLRDRGDGSEILVNVLSGVMFSCILQIQNPERFLFLTGHSATGQSTFFLLLTLLVSEHNIYTVSEDDFSCDFSLEDLSEGTPKSLIIFHDIGRTVSSGFINRIRTLVSSKGETKHKRIRRKNKKTGYLQFSGMMCAACPHLREFKRRV